MGFCIQTTLEIEVFIKDVYADVSRYCPHEDQKEVVPIQLVRLPVGRAKANGNAGRCEKQERPPHGSEETFQCAAHGETPP